jgi:hypothetical protein
LAQWVPAPFRITGARCLRSHAHDRHFAAGSRNFRQGIFAEGASALSGLFVAHTAGQHGDIPRSRPLQFFSSLSCFVSRPAYGLVTYAGATAHRAGAVYVGCALLANLLLVGFVLLASNVSSGNLTISDLVGAALRRRVGM